VEKRRIKMHKCPRKEYFCYAIECDCPKDPDTCHELHKEAIQANEADAMVNVGTVDLNLNGVSVGHD
jgi:hypothetical protein